MSVSLIVAHSENRAIGKDNQLIWHISEDLKRFKQLTMGHTLIMGRKNYESIGRPLPGRQTIILSRNPNYNANNCQIVDSIDKALKLSESDSEIFIAGGSDIYKMTLEADIVDKMYITLIHKEFDGDRFFPEYDAAKWKIILKEDHQDSENQLAFTYLDLIRIRD